MLASLFGALIGGLFALVGAWLALKWQAEHEAKGVAGAILAELSVAQRMLERDGVAALYQQMLNRWKTTGEIGSRQVIIDMFDNEPRDVLPIYYSMARKLDLLPSDLASEIVEYHANIVALPRVVVRFLGRQELDQKAVKDLATSVEARFHALSKMRASLIEKLAAFTSEPIRLLPVVARRQTVSGADASDG